MACMAASLQSRGLTGLSMNESHIRRKQVLTSEGPNWGAAGQPSLPLKLMGTQGTHKKDTQHHPGLKLQKLPTYHHQELSKTYFKSVFKT